MPQQKPDADAIAAKYGGTVDDIAAKYGGAAVEDTPTAKDDDRSVMQRIAAASAPYLGETLSGAIGTVGDVQVGALKGAGQTVVNLARIPHMIPGFTALADAAHGGQQSMSALDAADRYLAPTNTAQGIGKAGEQVAETLIPSGLISKAGTTAAKVAPYGLKTLARAGVEGMGAAGISGIQRNDMTLPALVAGGLSGASSVAGAVARSKGVVGALEKGAQDRMVGSIAPTVGPNKLRFGQMAEEVAPRLRTEPGMGALSRDAFRDKIGDRLVKAEQLLDDAAEARLSAHTFKTKPLIEDLERKRAALTAQAVKASETPLKPAKPFSGPLTKTPEPPKQPIGEDVVPGPHAARVAVIDQAIAEIKQLGEVASYEAIKRVRQAYDGPAKAVYHPSMTQDFLKAQGGKYGAADVTGVLRENLGKWDPATATANAEYAFWRKADDVVAALEEIERVRPKVGRQIMARLTGTMGGGAVAGAPGAAAGFILGPMVEAAVGGGATLQIQASRQMTRLAAALRKGDEMGAEAAAFNLRRLIPAAGAGTGQMSSRPQPTGAR